jgi:hypothetical protein
MLVPQVPKLVTYLAASASVRQSHEPLHPSLAFSFATSL